MGGPPEVEEDTKSDVSEITSQRTGSVLSSRDESDPGGLDAADAHSDSQPGAYSFPSLMLKMQILRTGCDTFLLRLVSKKLMVYQGQFSLLMSNKEGQRIKNTPTKEQV